MGTAKDHNTSKMAEAANNVTSFPCLFQKIVSINECLMSPGLGRVRHCPSERPGSFHRGEYNVYPPGEILFFQSVQPVPGKNNGQYVHRRSRPVQTFHRVFPCRPTPNDRNPECPAPTVRQAPIPVPVHPK